jgi:hypothetical protein
MYSWLLELAVKQAAGSGPHSIRKYRQYEEADRARTRYLTHRVLLWRQHVGRTASSLTAPSSPGWLPLPPTLLGRWVRIPLLHQSDRNCEQILSTWRGTLSLTHPTGRQLIGMNGICSEHVNLIWPYTPYIIILISNYSDQQMHTGRLKIMHNTIQNSYIFQRRDLVFFIPWRWRHGTETCSSFIQYVWFAKFYISLTVHLGIILVNNQRENYDLQSFMCICWLL